MTRWESNMIAVASGYLQAGQTKAAQDVLKAVLQAEEPEESKPVRVWVLDGQGMPQDEPIGRVACFAPSGGQTGHAGQPALALTPQNLSSQGENWHSAGIPDAWTEELK